MTQLLWSRKGRASTIRVQNDIFMFRVSLDLSLIVYRIVIHHIIIVCCTGIICCTRIAIISIVDVLVIFTLMSDLSEELAFTTDLFADSFVVLSATTENLRSLAAIIAIRVQVAMLRSKPVAISSCYSHAHRLHRALYTVVR